MGVRLFVPERLWGFSSLFIDILLLLFPIIGANTLFLIQVVLVTADILLPGRSWAIISVKVSFRDGDLNVIVLIVAFFDPIVGSIDVDFGFVCFWVVGGEEADDVATLFGLGGEVLDLVLQVI